MVQYSRCGCQTECPCVLVDGKGIEVTGTGNVDDPYVISTDGTIDCDLTMECVCSKIDGNTGIRCNANHGIELFISGDRGNGMKFGQDGGLYASCPNCLDNPNNCVRSVDDLDAKINARQFLWGTYQGGRLDVPWGTMRSIDNALAVQSDIDVQWVSSLKGAGAAIFPYPTFCSSQWSAHYEYASANSGYCNSIRYYKLHPAQWMNFTKDIQHYYDSGFDNREADGGRLLSQVYGVTHGKLINALFLSATETYGSVISTIRYWCAQRRTILFHWNPQRLSQAVGSGIPAGIMCFPGTASPEAPWSGNWTPTLAQEAKAAGADWAAVSMRLTDEQLRTFAAAGLKTLGFDTFRRVDAHRAVDLRFVGLLSDDMIYQRYEEALNPLPGFIQHPGRNSFVPYDRTTWGVGSAGSGQLFPPENPTGFRDKRGYFRTSGSPTNQFNGVYLPCWHLPANWGDYNSAAEDTDSIPAMLLGEISNHEYLSNPTGYRINWIAGWVNADESNYADNPTIVGNPPGTPNNPVDKFGLFFGAPDDRNISGENAYRTKGPGKAAQGYFCFIRCTTRELVIGMRTADDGDATTGYKNLANQTQSGGLIPANQLWQFRVDVRPGTDGGEGTITFWTDGGPSATQYQVSTTSRDAGRYRGGYVFITKEELDQTRFEARFAEVNIDLLDAQGQAMGQPKSLMPRSTPDEP